MYILICGRGIPSEKYPTQGIFEWNQAKALSELSEHKIIYFGIDSRSIRRKRKFGLEKKIHNEKFISYTLNIPLGNLPDKIYNFILTNILKKVVKKIFNIEGYPVLVHTHFYYLSYNLLFLKTELKLPFIITEHHSSLNNDIIDINVKKKAHQVYKYSDEVICVSNSFSKKLNVHFNLSCKTVPNIFDNNLFGSLENVQSDSKIIISVGRLDKNKGFDILIESFKYFNSEYDSLLYIIGKGEEESNLKLLVKSLKLEHKVVFLGNLTQVNIKKYHDQSRLFILLSEKETFGVAYIEALASGLPTIATDCGATKDFINSDRGLIVKREVHEVVKAMKYIWENQEKYSKQKISQGILEVYSGVNIVNELTKIYSKYMD